MVSFFIFFGVGELACPRLVMFRRELLNSISAKIYPMKLSCIDNTRGVIQKECGTEEEMRALNFC